MCTYWMSHKNEKKTLITKCSFTVIIIIDDASALHKKKKKNPRLNNVIVITGGIHVPPRSNIIIAKPA